MGIAATGAGRWLCFMLAGLLLLYRRDFLVVARLIEAAEGGLAQLKQFVSEKQVSAEAKFADIEARMSSLEGKPAVLAEESSLPQVPNEPRSSWMPITAAGVATVMTLGIVWVLSSELRRLSTTLAMSEVRILQAEQKIAGLENRDQIEPSEFQQSFERFRAEIRGLQEKVRLLSAKVESAEVEAPRDISAPIIKLGPESTYTMAKNELRSPLFVDQPRARFSKSESPTANSNVPFQSFQPAKSAQSERE